MCLHRVLKACKEKHGRFRLPYRGGSSYQGLAYRGLFSVGLGFRFQGYPILPSHQDQVPTGPD